MNRKTTNKLYNQTRRESTSQALLLDQLDAEKSHMVAQCYSEQQRFIEIRPIAFHYCLKYAHPHQFVAYLALTYYDRFLSRNVDIPVLIQGGGFERNLKLFVFVCFTIAYRKHFQQSASFHHFLNSNQMVNVSDIKKMELLIRKGLKGKVTTPPTAMEPMIMIPLISLLEMEEQQLEIVYYVRQILFSINHDIKFTKFRPSILTASAILVTCYRLYPVLYPVIRKKILKSGYFQSAQLADLKKCFDEINDDVITDSVFNPDKCPIYRRNLRREEGKKILVDNPPLIYEYKPDPKHPLKFYLEDDEILIDDFITEQQYQEEQEDRSGIKKDEEHRECESEIYEEEEYSEHESETETEEDDEEGRYTSLQRIIICLCNSGCFRCFGYKV